MEAFEDEKTDLKLDSLVDSEDVNLVTWKWSEMVVIPVANDKSCSGLDVERFHTTTVRQI